MQRIYTIWAKWDDEAKVWYVGQSDIPGLATEAPTTEKFVQNVTDLAGDLIALNSSGNVDDTPVELLWSGSQKLSLARC